MLESTVETALVERIKALGGDTRKVKWLCRNGAPDRLVMLPEVRQKYSHDGPKGRTYHSRVLQPAATVWVELKAPGELPEPHQLRRHKELRMRGCLVLVLDSTTAIDYWLEQFE